MDYPNGTHLIAGKEAPGGGDPFTAVRPATGDRIDPEYHESPRFVAAAAAWCARGCRPISESR